MTQKKKIKPKATKNKKTEKNLGGRPAFFKTPKALENKINQYFDDCPDRKTIILKGTDGSQMPFDIKAPTICGLALFLGFSSRSSFNDYINRGEEFSRIVKKARTRIELEYEKKLHDGQCTGAIFALKNMGWADKVENTNINTKNLSAEELKQLFDDA